MNDRAVFVITRKHASWATAAFLLLAFGLFAAGYYLGKQSMAERMADAVPVQHKVTHVTMPAHPLETVQHHRIVHHEQTEPAVRYEARLVGYGTKSKAAKFVDRLHARGIDTILKTRVSTTSGGKKVTWYQVVTAPFTDRAALEQHVRAIRQLENIHDPRIVPLKQQ